jgi:WD40 repeat protein
MHDTEDFFSPEMVDERLELSLLQRHTGTSEQDMSGADPNLRLISDLRYLYGAEGTENVRSLQRVWEHLQGHHEREERTVTIPELEPERHLYLLKPEEERPAPPSRSLRPRRGRNRSLLTVLAALLFLVVIAGSLLTIVHLTREAQANGSATATATPGMTPSLQATLAPDYPYAPPGNPIATSPPSPDAIHTLSWSPDSKQLAFSTQGKIWIWNIASKLYRPLLDASQAGESIKALAWSPDGRYLAVGTNPIQIVDVASGKSIDTYSADYPLSPVAGQTTLVTALAWSHNDGSMLAVATQHTDGTCYVFVWDRWKETGIYTFNGQGSAGGISSISWSGDNKYVASTDAQTVQAWEIHHGDLIFKRKVDDVTNVAWSPGPGLLAFVNQHTTQIWDVWQGHNNEGKLVSSYPASNGVLDWSDKGQYLATAEGKTVIIFDVNHGNAIYTYRGNAHYVSTLAWSPDGSSIATGESGTSGSNVIQVWSS